MTERSVSLWWNNPCLHEVKSLCDSNNIQPHVCHYLLVRYGIKKRLQRSMNPHYVASFIAYYRLEEDFLRFSLQVRNSTTENLELS